MSASLPARCVGPKVVRDYESNDRMFQTLLLALCRSMNLEVGGDLSRSPAILSVSAPDAATQDQLETRFLALTRELDEKLTAVTVGFIRERCGIEVRTPAPK